MASIIKFCARRQLSTSAAARSSMKQALEGRPDSTDSFKLWRNLTFFVAFPAIGLCMVNAYLGHVEDHHKPRPEFVKYEYMRIRNKRLPWGDGNKSLFHNPRVNALPDGYETEEEDHH